MRKAYVERNLSLREVAVEAGCGLRTAARWMKIHGIPRNPKRRNQPRGPDHPSWKGGKPKCPKCGKQRAYYAATCIACKDSSGQNNPNWRGEDVGYGQAHERVKRIRGLASSHKCLHCEKKRAEEWAYDHEDPDERREEGKRDKGRYSLDPNHYIPLCSPCHTRFDFPPPTHGTPLRYYNHGCRCNDCREAARMYQWRRRAAKRAQSL